MHTHTQTHKHIYIYIYIYTNAYIYVYLLIEYIRRDSLDATSSLKRDAALMCAKQLYSLLGTQIFISWIPESMREEMVSLMAA